MTSRRIQALLASALLCFAPSAAQAMQETEVNPGIGHASPEARALWAQLLVASGGMQGSAREPIKAFKLGAAILTRNGVESNESEFEYSYLSPDYVKFSLPSENVMGRFGKKAKEYWLTTPEGDATVLSGSDYLQDRKTIARMHAVARNFVALSDLGGLRDISSLGTIAVPPLTLLGRHHELASTLQWLRITSPSFGLQSARGSASTKRSYTADIGLAKDGPFRDLPLLAIIRDTSGASKKRISAPMMLQLGEYFEQDGFRIPKIFFVFYIEQVSAVDRFESKPAQEIYLQKADLRPLLSPDHFKP